MVLIVLDKKSGEHFECYYSGKSDCAINCTIVCADNICRVQIFKGVCTITQLNHVFCFENCVNFLNFV